MVKQKSSNERSAKGFVSRLKWLLLAGMMLVTAILLSEWRAFHVACCQNHAEGFSLPCTDFFYSVGWILLSLPLFMFCGLFLLYYIEQRRNVAKMRADMKITEQYRLDCFNNVTHDLKTPITAIKGASEIVMKQQCPNRHCAEYHAIIQRNIDRLTNMIQNMLDYSRLQTATLDMFFESCDLAEIVEDAMLTTIPAAWEHGIKVKYITPDRNFMISGDCERLTQAISNILMHAVFVSLQHTNIRIHIEEAERRYKTEFRFVDPEMAGKKEQIALFERYLQGEMQEPRHEYGLALALASGIIKMHGGSIVIEPLTHTEIALGIYIPAAG